jgi:hypothetical protein
VPQFAGGPRLTDDERRGSQRERRARNHHAPEHHLDRDPAIELGILGEWWTTVHARPELVHGRRRGCAEAACGSRGLRGLTGGMRLASDCGEAAHPEAGDAAA